MGSFHVYDGLGWLTGVAGKLGCVRAHYRFFVGYLCLYLTYHPVMVAENISLGILSLPSAVATLGIVP
jgi:hypothetical protein